MIRTSTVIRGHLSLTWPTSAVAANRRQPLLGLADAIQHATGSRRRDGIGLDGVEGDDMDKQGGQLTAQLNDSPPSRIAGVSSTGC